MKRSDFLKGIGIVGLGAALPINKSMAMDAGDAAGKAAATCTLVPSETAGPYPLDLSADNSKFRSAINESMTGLAHTITLKIVSAADCQPIVNARVDIWHCNKDGYYSGYASQPGYLGTQSHVGETFCRGIQMTDANGEVKFTTIFPGWYTGRVTHVHFQVYLSSMLQVTSQFSYPVDQKNSIYTSNALYSAHGADPTSLASDNVFSDGYTYQMATFVANSSGGYDSYLQAAINHASNGTTGLLKMEPETGGQFTLMQNYPNPYTEETTIPFTLTSASDVRIDLFDMMGRRAAVIEKGSMPAGSNEITVNMRELNLPGGNYIYQLQVSNEVGTYRQCKMMTAQK